MNISFDCCCNQNHHHKIILEDEVLKEFFSLSPTKSKSVIYLKYGKLKEQFSLLKYELKEKDLDIVQLNKEINELQLENKMFKSKLAFVDNGLQINSCDFKDLDPENPFVILNLHLAFLKTILPD
jgi:hypothetical protein